MESRYGYAPKLAESSNMEIITKKHLLHYFVKVLEATHHFLPLRHQHQIEKSDADTKEYVMPFVLITQLCLDVDRRPSIQPQEAEVPL